MALTKGYLLLGVSKLLLCLLFLKDNEPKDILMLKRNISSGKFCFSSDFTLNINENNYVFKYQFQS